MSQLLSNFGLSHHPFGRTPKQALFRHQGFEEAMKRLLFTVELYSIALLVADTGCGKSLLLGELSDGLKDAGWIVHYIAHSTVSPFGLVNVLARKAGLSPRRSRGETALALTDTLLESKTNTLLVIDEAHALPDSTLEDLRLLTVTDFDRRSPFLLLLAGQPEIEERLAEPSHRALDQRITTIARLTPLSLEETSGYIQQRMNAAGGRPNTPTFEEGAVEAIFDASGGIPRRINTLATAALIVAAARGRRVVTTQDVTDAKMDRGRL
jgi:type II secretory pathway predicted ATPase ExeA